MLQHCPAKHSGSDVSAELLLVWQVKIHSSDCQEGPA